MSSDANAATGAGLAPEDQARADYYALLARLWAAPPDAALLAAIAGSGDIAGPDASPTALGDSWRELRTAAATAGAVDEEYDAAFVGTGKAPITLYATHYLVPNARERLLAALRSQLGELGLARFGSSHEPEDHFAALCEVMRHLIVSGSGNDAALQQQVNFFRTYIAQVYNPLTDHVFVFDGARFYLSVARFTRAFLDVESAAFAML